MDLSLYLAFTLGVIRILRPGKHVEVSCQLWHSQFDFKNKINISCDVIYGWPLMKYITYIKLYVYIYKNSTEKVITYTYTEMI